MPGNKNKQTIKEYTLEKIGLFQYSIDQTQPNAGIKVIYPVISCLLKLTSFIYGFVTKIRNFSYDSGIFKIHKLDCKVISIGNITIGGTGKTPAVISLAAYLIEKNKKVEILREPGGTELSEKIRVMLLDNKNSSMAAETELLLFSASRALLVREKIRPYLQDPSDLCCK